MTGDLERQLRREERKRATWWAFWEQLEWLYLQGLISRDEARRRIEAGP